MARSDLACFVLLALGVSVHSHLLLPVAEEVATHSLVAAASHRLRRSEESGIEIDWNQLIDTLLLLAQQQIVADDKDQVTIPDVEEVFERKLGPLKVRGSFRASEGFVNSLSSLHRTGDFSLGTQGQSVSLTSHLGLKVLRVRYDRYRAEILGASTRGDISATVGSNSVRSVIKFEVRDDGCGVTLEEVKIAELGWFDVRISGLGPLDWLASRVATWVTENKRGDIIARLEEAMDKGLRAAIAKFKCDEYYAMIRGELAKHL